MPLKKFNTEYLYYHALVFDLDKFSYEETDKFLIKYGFDPYTHYFVDNKLIYIQTEGHLFYDFSLQKLKVSGVDGVHIWIGQLMY